MIRLYFRRFLGYLVLHAVLILCNKIVLYRFDFSRGAKSSGFVVLQIARPFLIGGIAVEYGENVQREYQKEIVINDDWREYTEDAKLKRVRNVKISARTASMARTETGRGGTYGKSS